MSTSDYNKITSIIDNISRDYTYNPESNNIICIDISNSRIGINTLDPEYSLHISGGTLFCSVISCVNLNVNKINGVLYNITLEIVNSNIIPSNNNSLTLGNVNTYWSNAYIRDLSVTSIDISKNILPLLPNSSNLGSLLKRWKTVYVDNISVNSINRISINSLTNNGTLLNISTGQIIATTISAETISSNSDIFLYDISLAAKINEIINRVNNLSHGLSHIPIIKTGFYGTFDITFQFINAYTNVTGFPDSYYSSFNYGSNFAIFYDNIQISPNPTISHVGYSLTPDGTLTIDSFNVSFTITKANRFSYITSTLTKILVPELTFIITSAVGSSSYTTTDTPYKSFTIDPPSLDEYGLVSTIEVTI